MAARTGREPASLSRALAVVLALALASRGALAHDTALGDDPWRWVRFGVGSGLPSDRILDVVETDDGTPWVATTDGIAWFDGHAWVASGEAGPSGSRRVSQLRPSGGGGVLAVAGGEVHLHSRAGVRSFRLTLGGEPVAALSAADVGGGEILVLVAVGSPAERHVATWRPSMGTPASLLQGSPSSPEALYVTPEGEVLLSSPSGLHRLLARGWKLLLPPDPQRHSALTALRDGDGLLVSLTSPIALRGLWRISPGSEPVRVAEAAHDLCRLADGSLLAAFDSGEVRVHRDGAWRALEGRRDLLQGVASVAGRPNGDAWLGSDHGLHLWRRTSRRWTGWRQPGADLHNHVSGILRRGDGSTWLSTTGGVVILEPGAPARFVDEVGGQRLSELTTIAEDPRGRVWVASGASFPGAWRLDENGWTHVGQREGLTADRIHAIERTADGRTWFLGLPAVPWGEETAPAHVLVLRDDDTFEPWGATHGLDAVRVYDVLVAGDGTIWFGTAGGPVRWRQGQWRRFTAADGMRHSRSGALALGPDGRLWCATFGAGLCVIDRDDRLTYLDSRQGLVDDEVNGLAFDAEGRLWIATQDGLGVLDGDRLTSFRSEAGLPVPRAWPVVPEQGTILLGTLGAGLAVLDLASFDVRPPRVRLPAPLVEGDRALIRWDALAWWGDPSPDSLETRLRIDDGDWSPWQRSREALATDLSPGTHGVRVEARGLLLDDASSAEATFDVQPPLWRHPAFLALAAALLASGIALAVVLWARDRHERRALETSEQRYRQLVEEATEVVFALDASGRVAWSNAAGAELLGRQRGELRGRDVMEAVAPESRAVARDALITCRRTGRVVTFEIAVLAKDGTRRIVEVALGPGGTAGRAGWQGIGRDITERRRREEERQHAQRLESLGLLAGGIAHDFNNVLAGVVGQAELAMLEVPEDSPARNRLELIERSAMHCSDLARQMLDYAGRGRFAVGPADVGAVVESAVEMARADLRVGSGLRCIVPPGLPPIEGDAVQLQRVFANLLRNAIGASPSGVHDIVVDVRHAPEGTGSVDGAWSGAPPEGPVVLVSVTDRGVGMDEATRARAFDPFFSTRKDGRGLGLAASLGIVRAHRGSIAVRTAPGEGATFTVALPLMS